MNIIFKEAGLSRESIDGLAQQNQDHHGLHPITQYPKHNSLFLDTNGHLSQELGPSLSLLKGSQVTTQSI